MHLAWRLARLATELGCHLLWPTRCAGCDTTIGLGAAFCGVCEATLVTVDPACLRCAAACDEGVCVRCATAPPPFAGASAALAYGGALSEGILRLKHGARRDLARPLGAFLAPIVAAAVESGVDVAMPVPLHPRKLARRGYNQALELLRVGRRLAGRGAHSVPELWVDALARVRDDGDMGHGTIAERKARVAGAFVVPARARRRVAGRRVLVADDVMTTGATLGACTDALLDAGAREVHVAALARAL